MKWNAKQIAAAICLMAVCGFSVARAQEMSERELRRMQEAETRAQEAQAGLQRALELLAEAQESDEARRQLDESIRDLQRARSRLGNEGIVTAWSSDPGNLFVSRSLRGSPQMGVYLNTERRPVTDSIGVVLNSVVDDGPADEAGLREGDIITVANGEQLARTGRRGTSPANKLIQIKDDLEEGDTLHVEYRRGATTHSADLEVRYLENSVSIAVDNFVTSRSGYASPNITVLPEMSGSSIGVSSGFARFYGGLSRLGILDVELIELDEELGWYFGVEEGLLIVRAPDDDLELDLRGGDVIVSVDGRRPSSQTQLMRILRSYEEGETMQLSIMRQREAVTIDVTIPERDGDGALLLRRGRGRF